MCKAGCNHEELKRNPLEWLKLQPIGNMVIEDDESGPGYTLEMRNCKCGSTLAVERPLH